jgi:hypothetical protein
MIYSEYLFLFQLIVMFIEMAHSNPLNSNILFERYRNENIINNRRIIRANIGDNITISCWFDLKTIMSNKKIRIRRNNNSNDKKSTPTIMNSSTTVSKNIQILKDHTGKRDNYRHHVHQHHNKYKRHPFDLKSYYDLKQSHHTNSDFLFPSASSDRTMSEPKPYQNYYQQLMKTNQNNNDDFGMNIDRFKTDSMVSNPQSETDTYRIKGNDEMSPFSLNNIKNDLSDSNDVVYELDWYFLDKKGRMNIISYGNKTRFNMRYKYKPFIANERKSIRAMLSDDNTEDEKNTGNNLKFSALYSKQYYSSSKSRSPHTNNMELTTNTGNKGYFYYLNVLIESENDEGVYQCMNPDWPDYVIQNVTVELTSNFYIKNIILYDFYNQFN